jgi:hypothetical protein
MKAEATGSKVVCDEPGCGWSEKCDFADVPKWHKKPCPKCGKGEIVSDEDMVVFGLAEAAVKITNYIDPDGKMKRQTYHVNTAPLRTANITVSGGGVADVH